MSTAATKQEISDDHSNQQKSPREEQKENDNTFKTKSAVYEQKTYTLASTKEERVYKSSITEHEKPDTIEDMIADLEDTSLTEKDRIYRESFASIMNLNQNLVSESIRDEFESFITELSEYNFTTPNEWRKGMRPLLKKHPKIGHPKKAAMRRIYLNLLHMKKINKNAQLENYLIAKASRTKSGVMVVTVLTSPFPRVNNKFQKFSCKHNCYYC
eukprot:51494_1